MDFPACPNAWKMRKEQGKQGLVHKKRGTYKNHTFLQILTFCFLNMYDLQDKILKNNQNKLDDVV